MLTAFGTASFVQKKGPIFYGKSVRKPASNYLITYFMYILLLEIKRDECYCIFIIALCIINS